MTYLIHQACLHPLFGRVVLSDQWAQIKSQAYSVHSESCDFSLFFVLLTL